jgi:GDPmannose 4,6-dehydratase
LSEARLQNLIVGHTGQDGILLRELLDAAGKSWFGVSGSVADSSADRAAEWFDVSDADAVSEFIGRRQPEKIYYLAAAHTGSGKAGNANLFDLYSRGIGVNVQGPLNFLGAIARSSPDTRLVFASSSLVFAPTEDPEQLISEGSPIAPGEAYAAQKLLTGQTCQDFRQRLGVHASVAYLFNHESRHRRGGFFTRHVTAGIRRILDGETRELEIGSLEAIVDWSYAGDVVAALKQIVDLDNPGEYIVASGVGHTIGQFLEIAFRCAGLKWQDHVKVNPALLGRVNSCRVGDAGRLMRDTSWRPRTSFETMIENLIHPADGRHRTR